MWSPQQRKVSKEYGVKVHSINTNAAKHLEPLKGGKIPLEILVTSKEPEQKKKVFDKCLEAIKNAGVCSPRSSYIPGVRKKANPKGEK